MDKLKDLFGGLFGILAMIFWIAAICALLWQAFGWISNGEWPSLTLGQLAPHIFNDPTAGGSLYPMVALAVLGQQSLALACGLLGLGCNGLNKAFGG